MDALLQEAQEMADFLESISFHGISQEANMLKQLIERVQLAELDAAALRRQLGQ